MSNSTEKMLNELLATHSNTKRVEEAGIDAEYAVDVPQLAPQSKATNQNELANIIANCLVPQKNPKLVPKN
ncbi:hypothetical protein [Legionella fairfieldensis]|uniref:hypothetical protein n=1 Tax=Legionella fairfieldensis TaxID=45064 RepID=UPI00048C3CE2|nr:hypothetical protein [Legionella fairfieldensis]